MTMPIGSRDHDTLRPSQHRSSLPGLSELTLVCKQRERRCKDTARSGVNSHRTGCILGIRSHQERPNPLEHEEKPVHHQRE
jgi:hypothetical protein